VYASIEMPTVSMVTRQ